jgi:copper chaperone NosL
MAPDDPVVARRRRIIVGLAVAGALLFAVSYFLPWWRIDLYAPQYPDGLTVKLHLTGVEGDVQEVNTLNHYIGMAPLEEAAKRERRLAPWLVAGVGVAIVTLLVLTGRSLRWLAVVIAVGLPIGFVADSVYWMHRFGHNLDPRAPLNFDPFQPQLFGVGHIGQFRTVAMPGVGFWVAVAAFACVLGAVLTRGHKVAPLRAMFRREA